jgi:predicted exporter
LATQARQAAQAIARTRRELIGTVVVTAATLLAAAVVAIRLLAPVSPIDTDIMALVPQDERDPVLAAAIERAATLVGSRIGFLVQHKDPTLRAAAAADLRAALEATRLFVPVEDEAAALARWLFGHRDQLLCPTDRALLERGQGAVLAQQALAQIYAPLVPIRSDLLRADPMLLTLRLVDCFSPPAGRSADGTLVAGRLTVSPYGLDAQDQIETAVARWQKGQAGNGITLARFGALFHAAAAAGRARVEIAWVSCAAILGVLALFLSLFASLRAALLALIAMVVGTLGGLAACLALFAHVHVLALVFGAAMSGIAVDYAIHVMVAGLVVHGQGQSRCNPARTIARPLLTCLLTTLAGFACLLVSGIGVLQQIAVFGGAGILLSFGFSRFVLGRWCPWAGRISRPARGFAAVARRLLGWSASPALLGSAAVVLLPIVGFGLLRLAGSDDVRGFQPVPAGLEAEEKAVAAAAGHRIDARFLLVRAAGVDALRAGEAHAIEGTLRPLPAPAWLDPAPGQQAADRQLIAQRLLVPELAPIAGMLELDPATVYEQSPPGGALPSPFAEMRGTVERMNFSIIPLTAEDAQRLDRAAVGGGAELVDPAAVYSALLERFRHRAVESLMLALVACGLGVLVIYRRLASLRLLVPAGLSIALVPAIAGLAGQTFSLFSVMGLFVALGLSIDFAAFQAIDREPGNGSTREGWREASILAAAITTVVPMTLLSFSDTLPVRHFGTSVALGTALGLILSPLARWPRPSGEGLGKR